MSATCLRHIAIAALVLGGRGGGEVVVARCVEQHSTSEILCVKSPRLRGKAVSRCFDLFLVLIRGRGGDPHLLLFAQPTTVPIRKQELVEVAMLARVALHDAHEALKPRE